MSNPFKSMNGHAVDFDEPQTAEEMASELALEMIDRIKARRKLATEKELACEESEPWQPRDAEAWQVLETLIGKPSAPGRHRQTVLRLLFEHFPELVTQMKVN